jgi:hypothetical protein
MKMVFRMHCFYVIVIHGEFIKIRDNKSYFEEVKGFRGQNLNFVLKERREKPRICES